MSTTRLTVLVTFAALASLAACDNKSDSVPAAGGTAPSTKSTEVARTDTPRPAPAPDNTATNKVDRSGTTKTPMAQSESSADIKVTAEIRRAIMDDKTMSTNAQNCKIITDKAGLVTLRGVVNSQTEKDSIAAKAVAIAGVTKVDNQLEVKVN